jgi:hypothetical protein
LDVKLKTFITIIITIATTKANKFMYVSSALQQPPSRPSSNTPEIYTRHHKYCNIFPCGLVRAPGSIPC